MVLPDRGPPGPLIAARATRWSQKRRTWRAGLRQELGRRSLGFRHIGVEDVAMQLPLPAHLFPDDDVLAVVDPALGAGQRVLANLVGQVTGAFHFHRIELDHGGALVPKAL